MRLVLDTNVLVSGTFWTGSSFKVISLIDQDKVLFIVSPAILSEYDRILHSDEILDKTTLYQQTRIKAIHKLLSKALIVDPKQKFNVANGDPDDNKFLEAAIEGKADYIISKDKHLLNIKIFKDIPILTPEQFLNILQ
ncbi:putative toxin-antitoxin system toxin component, PIN family [Candidatus Woesearchaeota archaeon CG10_big_fil_rev_8_21_14_0_10_33_12]|nr:MAG: putative toxin-antitoxin system toxin component, PIN family [Candidatus Woesearchaeota archaeon CG10_big_fil_rev_8_21_14_0_10_33_12]